MSAGTFLLMPRECRGMPPAMETGIRLDTITTLSLVRSQWTGGKTVSPEAEKINYKLLYFCD